MSLIFLLLLYFLKNSALLYVLKNSTLSYLLYFFYIFINIFFSNNISKFYVTYLNNVSIVFNLLFANAIILLCFSFLFLVTFSNDLFIPVLIVNIKVKEEPAIPTGIPTTAAYEAILNVLNDADKVMNILSR